MRPTIQRVPNGKGLGEVECVGGNFSNELSHIFPVLQNVWHDVMVSSEPGLSASTKLPSVSGLLRAKRAFLLSH